jgi:pimeloyl-ACP methyl ester carboxylesterase
MKEQRFDAGEVELNYVEGPPSGPPLLLLHGLATRWQIFRPLIRGLPSQWHVYALDFRGHGKSGWAPGRYSVEALVRDTEAFMRGNVKEPAVLFGHSMGGWVAAQLAVQLPDRVRAIVLADTALYPARVPDDATLSALFGIDPSIIRSGTFGSVGSWPQSLSQLDPALISAYLDGRLVEGFDADTVLPRVSCPVLLLQGDPAGGGFMTDQDVAAARRLLPNLEHVCFDGAGHWLHVQDADRVVRELQRFLSSL